MLWEVGFFNTSAPMFLDISLIYFSILPFLLYGSIYFAKIGKYEKHLKSQFALLFTTLIIVFLFEVGVRVTGGFLEYSKQSNVSFTFMLFFLATHVGIAFFAIAGWVYLLIKSFLAYKQDKSIEAIKNSNHKTIGRAVGLALTISSFMGVAIYFFLFVF